MGILSPLAFSSFLHDETNTVAFFTDVFLTSSPLTREENVRAAQLALTKYEYCIWLQMKYSQDSEILEMLSSRSSTYNPYDRPVIKLEEVDWNAIADFIFSIARQEQTPPRLIYECYELAVEFGTPFVIDYTHMIYFENSGVKTIDQVEGGYKLLFKTIFDEPPTLDELVRYARTVEETVANLRRTEDSEHPPQLFYIYYGLRFYQTGLLKPIYLEQRDAQTEFFYTLESNSRNS